MDGVAGECKNRVSTVVILPPQLFVAENRTRPRFYRRGLPEVVGTKLHFFF